MKTMTCNQLGGPCDFPHHAASADEAIKSQDRHLNEMVAGGDETHGDALEKMKSRWYHPITPRWAGTGPQNETSPSCLKTDACASACRPSDDHRPCAETDPQQRRSTSAGSGPGSVAQHQSGAIGIRRADRHPL